MGDRMTWRPASVIAIVMLATVGTVSVATATREHWGATWTATLEGGPPQPGRPNPLATVKNQTVRIPVTISVGGPRLRLKLSNEYGSKPLVIGAASVAVANADGTVRPFVSVPDGIAISKANADWTVKAGPIVKVTFGGASQVTIPRAASILSDVVEMGTTALQDLAIGLYLPEETVLSTFHNE